MNSADRDPLTHQIIGAAIEVHRNLGPGMLESAYEECFCFELVSCGLSVQRQTILPLVYKGVQLDIGYRSDLIIDRQVIVELKTWKKFSRCMRLKFLPIAPDRPRTRSPDQFPKSAFDQRNKAARAKLVSGLRRLCRRCVNQH